VWVGVHASMCVMVWCCLSLTELCDASHRIASQLLARNKQDPLCVRYTVGTDLCCPWRRVFLVVAVRDAWLLEVGNGP